MKAPGISGLWDPKRQAIPSDVGPFGGRGARAGQTQETHGWGGGLGSEAGLSMEPLGLTLESAHHGHPIT